MADFSSLLLLACVDCAQDLPNLNVGTEVFVASNQVQSRQSQSVAVPDPIAPISAPETSPSETREFAATSASKQSASKQSATPKSATPDNSVTLGNSAIVPIQTMNLMVPAGGGLLLITISGVGALVLRHRKGLWQNWKFWRDDEWDAFDTEEIEPFDETFSLKQTNVWSHAIVWGLIGFTIFGVIWTATAEMDEAVPVQGKLEPQGAVKEIQAPVGGVVQRVHVKDGQRVKKGDLLVSFDPTVINAKLKSLIAIRTQLIQENQFYRTGIGSVTGNKSPQLAMLLDNRASLVRENQLFRAQLSGGIAGLDPAQRDRLAIKQRERSSRLASAQLNIEQLIRQLNQTQIQLANAKDALETNSAIAENLEGLVKEGIYARLPYLEKQQTANTSQAEVNRLGQEVDRLRIAIIQAEEQLQNAIAVSSEDVLARIAENDKRIAEIDSQLAKVILENDKRITEINSQLSEAQQTLKYQELRASTDGVVFDLKPRSPGYVYSSSEPILKLVPAGNLVAQVFITNKDIGFVKPGMPVDVRIDSFPHSEFGDIKGQLVRIGSDALPPDQANPFYRFPAEIRIEKQFIPVNGNNVQLQSGMSLNGNINIRKRKVLSIFTDQLFGKMDNLKHMR